MISVVYGVDIVCRTCDGKTHYLNITWIYLTGKTKQRQEKPLSTKKIEHCPIFWKQTLILKGMTSEINNVGLISISYLEGYDKQKQ